MTNDELAAKLGHLEGFLHGMGESVKRIEGGIEKVIALDRSVAEHGVRFEAHQREIRELAHDIKNCQNTHKLADELQSKRIDKLDADANQVRGVLLAMKIFSGFMAFLVLTASTWVYNRIEANSTMNASQANDISELRRDLAQLRKESGK